MFEGVDGFAELQDESFGLSSHALSALSEFLSEQKQSEEVFSALQRQQRMGRSGTGTPMEAISDGDATSSSGEDSADEDVPPLSMDLFKEDWQLSQFWYDDLTTRVLGDELVRRASGGLIACVSAPTVFLYLKNRKIPNPLVLLEIDTRFAVFPEFKVYDYNHPEDVAGLEDGGALRGAAAAVLLDPPFLNEDCASKSAQTVRALCNTDTSVIVSTGWSVREVIARTLSAHIANFRPRHNGGLANAFRTYINYSSSEDANFELSTTPDDGDNDFEDQK